MQPIGDVSVSSKREEFNKKHTKAIEEELNHESIC
jgi:hypothetical protein